MHSRPLDLAGFNEHGQVVSINVAGTSFGDDEFQHLGVVPSLRELHVADTRVTDRGLVDIGLPENLERLFLAKCEITDNGLRNI